MQVEAKVINVGAGIGGVLNPISCPSHEAQSAARTFYGHIPIAQTLDNAAGVRCSASKIDAATC